MLRIDTSGVMIRVTSLLSDCLDLLKGFHEHWPPGYTMELYPDNLGTVVIIMMPNDQRNIYVIKPADGTDGNRAKLTVEEGSMDRVPERKLTVEDALCFMDEVKNLCDLETYEHFLDIMTAFKANKSVLARYP